MAGSASTGAPQDRSPSRTHTAELGGDAATGATVHGRPGRPEVLHDHILGRLAVEGQPPVSISKRTPAGEVGWPRLCALACSAM
jgi:hypothetical protein